MADETKIPKSFWTNMIASYMPFGMHSADWAAAAAMYKDFSSGIEILDNFEEVHPQSREVRFRCWFEGSYEKWILRNLPTSRCHPSSAVTVRGLYELLAHSMIDPLCKQLTLTPGISTSGSLVSGHYRIQPHVLFEAPEPHQIARDVLREMKKISPYHFDMPIAIRWFSSEGVLTTRALTEDDLEDMIDNEYVWKNESRRP